FAQVQFRDFAKVVTDRSALLIALHRVLLHQKHPVLDTVQLGPILARRALLCSACVFATGRSLPRPLIFSGSSRIRINASFRTILYWKLSPAAYAAAYGKLERAS